MKQPFGATFASAPRSSVLLAAWTCILLGVVACGAGRAGGMGPSGAPIRGATAFQPFMPVTWSAPISHVNGSGPICVQVWSRTRRGKGLFLSAQCRRLSAAEVQSNRVSERWTPNDLPDVALDKAGAYQIRIVQGESREIGSTNVRILPDLRATAVALYAIQASSLLPDLNDAAMTLTESSLPHPVPAAWPVLAHVQTELKSVTTRLRTTHPASVDETRAHFLLLRALRRDQQAIGLDRRAIREGQAGLQTAATQDAHRAFVLMVANANDLANASELFHPET